MSVLLAALLLAGCAKESTDAYWLQGAAFSWEHFNHRVTHLEWAVDDQAPVAAIIGGTSTTGVSASLPDTCDPDTCGELPFTDSSDVALSWVSATSQRVVFARGSIDLVADAGGVSGTLTVPLPRKAKGVPVALIAGLALDTGYALSGGDACYNPAYGWHPQHIAAVLDTPTLADDRLSVEVPVQVTFQAGNSLEEMRQCIDDVNEQAQVPFRIDVVVAVTPDATQSAAVQDSDTYSYGDGPANPDPQPELAVSPSLGLDLASPVVGWSALDWRFHVDDPDDRGAYLRSLSFVADPDIGVASGQATNYSPLTQLTDFDYAFDGVVVGLDMSGGSAEGGTSTGTLPADLDDQGLAVVHSLDW